MGPSEAPQAVHALLNNNDGVKNVYSIEQGGSGKSSNTPLFVAQSQKNNLVITDTLTGKSLNKHKNSKEYGIGGVQEYVSISRNGTGVKIIGNDFTHRTNSNSTDVNNEIYSRQQNNAIEQVKQAFLPDHLQGASFILKGKTLVGKNSKEKFERLNEATHRFVPGLRDDGTIELHFAKERDKQLIQELFGESISGSIAHPTEIIKDKDGKEKPLLVNYIIPVEYTDGNEDVMRIYRKYVENKKVERSRNNLAGKIVPRGNTKKYSREGGKEYDRTEGKMISLEAMEMYDNYYYDTILPYEEEERIRLEEELTRTQQNEELIRIQQDEQDMNDQIVQLKNFQTARNIMDNMQKIKDMMPENIDMSITGIDDEIDLNQNIDLLVSDIAVSISQRELFAVDLLIKQVNDMLDSEDLTNSEITEFENGRFFDGKVPNESRIG